MAPKAAINSESSIKSRSSTSSSVVKFSDTWASDVCCSREEVGSLIGAMGKLSVELNKFGASWVSPNNELTGAGTEGVDASVGGLGMAVLASGGKISAILSSSNKS